MQLEQSPLPLAVKPSSASKICPSCNLQLQQISTGCNLVRYPPESHLFMVYIIRISLLSHHSRCASMHKPKHNIEPSLETILIYFQGYHCQILRSVTFCMWRANAQLAIPVYVGSASSASQLRTWKPISLPGVAFTRLRSPTRRWR